MIKISLCLLTKNNENSLQRCFYPIKEFLHEILVVDLGSTDDTLKILRENDAKIIDFKFNNDFSAAKNKLIDSALGDLILFLNPNEVIFKESMQNLMDYLNKNPEDDAMAYMFNIRNYTNNTNARGFKPSRIYDFEGYFTSEQARLMRNNKKIRFSFLVDESLMPALDKMNAGVKHIVDVPIHNYAYHAKLKLLESVVEGSSDTRTMYNLAIAYLNNGDLLKSKEFFKKVVEKMPSYKKALFNLGSIYMRENKLEIALKLFQESLEFDNKNAGVYYNLGLIFSKNKQFDKAEVLLKKALSLEAEDFRIYRALALMYRDVGNIEMAGRAINSALKYNSQDKGLLDIKNSLEG